MKKFVLLVFVLFAVAAFAQNAPIPTQTVTTTFSAVSLPGNSQTFAATVADVGISFTPNTTALLETLQSPGAPNFNGFYGAGGSYQLNFLSKKLNDVSPALSGFRLRFSLVGSAGEARVGDRNHFGGTARFRTEYALTPSGSWNLGLEVGAVRLPGVTPGWGKLFAFGLPVHF